MRSRLLSRSLTCPVPFTPPHPEANTAIRFSLAVPHHTPPTAVVNAIPASVLATASTAPTPPDAAIVLASPGLATWLDDPTFVAALLARTLPAPAHRELSVLSAVVDGVATDTPGLSVLAGTARTLLPGLWEGAQAAPRAGIPVKRVGERDAGGALAVRAAARLTLRSRAHVQLTVPLANTVFATGRRTTLTAAAWQRGETGLACVRAVRKRFQTVELVHDGLRELSLGVPLIPITAPRRVVAEFGNIVRQVEVSGESVPASRELEGAVSGIYNVRAKTDPQRSGVAVDVWALMIPEEVFASDWYSASQTLGLQSASPEAFGARDDWGLARQTSSFLSLLLRSGCRLSKVLSGGGGWGAKQGLLSLDPELSFEPSSEEDDMQMFDMQLASQANASSDTPEANARYVQFFTSPAEHSPDGLGGDLPSEWGLPHNGLDVFGVCPENSEVDMATAAAAAAATEAESAPRFTWNVFQALSARGVCIDSSPVRDMSSVGVGNLGLRSKIDAPHSRVLL